ncbi:hypothetical protein FisN_3Lh518 [Fistulifera solaris]|uniref:Haem-binding uptake Tiki superfamily ChaN domain-containing protein n=1 Tax=Fistulifera solaris TaxID=1519565 RepID=A0A1Z5J8K2_FISSO|nr:hypothetical protein FisN_3Lh518 [Fistulifera solaris]|eukprot:GAX10315.1 hypothetical protein FisN_3Lh518 [Fistulifera solaris]
MQISHPLAFSRMLKLRMSTYWLFILSWSSLTLTTHSFSTLTTSTPITTALDMLPSRRQILSGMASTVVLKPQIASAADYRPAIRPTAYRVDSTIPPTLLPLRPSQQTQILKELAQGSGTNKQAIVVDTINLNNMLNKAVFGTIESVTKTRPQAGPTFVCLGLPQQCTASDIQFAADLVGTMASHRRSSKESTALGLPFPYSVQSMLNQYMSNQCQEDDLLQALSQANVDFTLQTLYQPLWQIAKIKKLDLIALSPEIQDIQAVQKGGLQTVDMDRRTQYVIDPQGFIALPQDPKFKVYTDRSLIKDLPPTLDFANFFSQTILEHETAATACAQYAANHGTAPLVVTVTPMVNVRFLYGLNGRIPRLCRFLGQFQVTDDSVTTILLNPTAEDTLSKSRFLRLEIGTGPETLAYQSKVADYLWFDHIPKVNLIPRLMDG